MASRNQPSGAPKSAATGTASSAAALPFHVETYISGHAYKERDFATLGEAQAYQRELWGMRHYFVPITEGEAAETARRQLAASRAFHNYRSAVHS